MRSSYACAVGQWLEVKITTRTFDLAKSFSRQVFPSAPGSLKSGAGEPSGNVGYIGSAAVNALARPSRSKRKWERCMAESYRWPGCARNGNGTVLCGVARIK